jgi:hypothetical protein
MPPGAEELSARRASGGRCLVEEQKPGDIDAEKHQDRKQDRLDPHGQSRDADVCDDAGDDRDDGDDTCKTTAAT